jgi:uncharacterized delta-60 repeat protein
MVALARVAGILVAGPARASTTLIDQSAVAVWRATNECLESVITVNASQSLPRPTLPPQLAATSVTIAQTQACGGSQPYREFTGETWQAVKLTVRDDLGGAHLVGPIPLQCHEYLPGACSNAPSRADLNLLWQSTGGIRSTSGDRTCLYHAGRAYGALQLASVDLLRDVAGHQVRSDPDATNVGRCGASRLDPAFGHDGTVLSTLTTNTNMNALAVQGDGRIVVAGEIFGEDFDDFALARFETTGALDTSFGDGGWVRTDIKTGDDRALAVAVQRDGRILAAGQAGRRMAVARYLSDGRLDQTFGFGGRVVIDITESAVSDIAVDAQGRIVLVGGLLHPVPPTCCSSDFLVVRLTGNGTRDYTFGTLGVARTDFQPGPGVSFDEPNSVLIQPDGRIVAAGQGGSTMDFALARYLPDGSLDGSFGTGGLVTTDIPGNVDRIGDIAFDHSGRIVAGGQTCLYPPDTGPQCDFALARYLPGGRLDGTFGGNGMVRTNVRAKWGEGIDGIAIQNDGQIVAAGYVTGLDPSNLGTDVGLTRYHADGHLDLGFGAGGIIIHTVTPDDDLPSDMTLDRAGRILVVGTAISRGVARTFVSRFTTAG